MRWHPQDDKTSALIAATAGAAEAGRHWEFLLARYEELRGVHGIVQELLKGRNHKVRRGSAECITAKVG